VEPEFLHHEGIAAALEQTLLERRQARSPAPRQFPCGVWRAERVELRDASRRQAVERSAWPGQRQREESADPDDR
jgi:hypothetical protein